MAHLPQYRQRVSARHNVVAFLDDAHPNSVPFRPMIQFLRRSRIYQAITANTTIYLNQIDEFYKNATVHSEGEDHRIRSTVYGHPIEITTDTVRQVLGFVDEDDQPTQFESEFINGGLQRMGYPAIPEHQYRKQHLSRVWRYLAHVLIVCLSPRKAGFDGMSFATLSAMLALVYNKPYNFSGYVFGNMVENVQDTKSKWLMYPRFVQLLLDSFGHDYQIDVDTRLAPTPMLLRVFGDCQTPPKGQTQLPDVALFGHIADENYVAPPNDGFLDPVVPPPQPENVEQFIEVQVQEDQQRIDEVVDDIVAGRVEEVEVPVQEVQQRIDEVVEVEVQRRADKRPMSEVADSSEPRSVRPRRSTGVVIAPQQPQPDVYQQLLDQIVSMQQRFDAQSVMLQSQSAKIAQLETQVETIPGLKAQVDKIQGLESRLLELESVASVSGGDEGLRTLESQSTAPPEQENVNVLDENEPPALDYLVSSAPIQGQPQPLNIDYSQVDLDFLRNMIYEEETVVNAEETVPDENSVDVEDERVNETYEDPDEMDMEEEAEVEADTEIVAPAVATTESTPAPQQSESTSTATETEVIKTCTAYKVGNRRLKGLIISWKYDDVNRKVIVKRLDGLQYFNISFYHLSTLPFCELIKLAQMNIVNPNNQFIGNEIQRVIRKEVNSRIFFLLKPNLGKRRIYRNRINPITKRPWVKIVYKSPKCLKYNPLEILPLNFLRRLKLWLYDSNTGEAEIVFVPDSEPQTIWLAKNSRIRVYDPLSLINLTKSDLEALHNSRISYIPRFEAEALRFQKVVAVCLAQGVFAGGKFPADWK